MKTYSYSQSSNSNRYVVSEFYFLQKIKLKRLRSLCTIVIYNQEYHSENKHFLVCKMKLFETFSIRKCQPKFTQHSLYNFRMKNLEKKDHRVAGVRPEPVTFSNFSCMFLNPNNFFPI